MNDACQDSIRPPVRVCFPFVGDTVGGSHIDALLHAQHLDRNRYEPVIVLHEEGNLADYLQQINMTYEILPLSGYFGRMKGALGNGAVLVGNTIRLIRFLRKNRISLVHTYDARMHYTWGLPARLSGGYFVWDQQAQWANSRMYRLFARLAHQIICISDFVRSRCPSKRCDCVATIRPPFQTELTPPSRVDARAVLLEKIQADPKSILVGFCSNFYDQKRPHIFVQMASIVLKESNLPIQFIMAGNHEGEVGDRIRDLIREQGIEERVHLLGFMNPIEPVLAGYDVFVAPAVHEGFGRTLVESMLVGTPVIAADSGGHQGIIEPGRTGYLVPPEDANAFAQTVLEMFNTPARILELAECAQREAREKYAASIHANAVMKLYDRLRSSVRFLGRSIN